MRNKTVVLDKEAYMYFIDKNDDVKEVKGTIHIDHIEGTFLGKNINHDVASFTYINDAGDTIYERVSSKEGYAECNMVWLLESNKIQAVMELAANLIHSAQMHIEIAERCQKVSSKLLNDLRSINEKGKEI